MGKTTAKTKNTIDDRMKRLESRMEKLKISKQISDLRAKQKALK